MYQHSEILTCVGSSSLAIEVGITITAAVQVAHLVLWWAFGFEGFLSCICIYNLQKTQTYGDEQLLIGFL